MNEKRRELLTGALKSGVSAATGLIVSLPAVDPEHFAITNINGILHILGLIAWVTVAAEARFWKQWSESSN
jgi:hypothetical protein